MPVSLLDKALSDIAGKVTRTELLALQTKFPWVKYDVQLMELQEKQQNAKDDFMTGGFLIDKFEARVASHPQKAMLVFEDCVFTYGFMNEQANRVAYVARRHLGLKFGDTVAVMIPNDPAFVWTVLGFQKMGIAVALINTNLRMKSLVHSVLATEPKAFIVGAGEDSLHAATDVLEKLQGLRVYVQGQSPGSGLPAGVTDFDSLMKRALPVQPDHGVRAEMTYDSITAYLYTSGTTGFPKPVYISHRKAMGLACVLSGVDLSPDDVLYAVLPLFHILAGTVGLFGVIHKGCTMVLKRKFSASHFWSDCRRHNVTVLLYIGEIFRYILAQPKHELDNVHKVRVALGNGLRKDIFEEVLRRFQIPLVYEAFGATEGIFVNYNTANKPGAVGRLSPFLTLMDPNPSVLVMFDYSSAMPVRDQHGRCIKVKPGEAGLYLNKVPDHMLSNGTLAVYKASREANESKLVRNAFTEGDVYFSYGDILYLDEEYFLYFYDRIGDTFRWKGENVSTTEVANIMCCLDFIHDVNVYGVEIPGHSGRAGMAALTLKEGERMTPEQLMQVYKVCQDDLPFYARPLFLRVLPEVQLSATFKHRKVEFVQQGYDLTKVKDDLYYLNSKAKTYSPLTAEALVPFLQSKL
ncbi:long-chain fatty acid transport protein 2-like [Babylonia areolata]|uniref:long-chain fatty acid transport protein 2-like n=1 Tax=Babylonia areolata TaxID=304850 RepID=UPI003FD5AD43